MKKLRILKDTLIDLGGLIQAIVYISAGIVWVLNKISITSSYKLIALSLFLFTILGVFLKRVITEVIIKTKNVILEENVEADLANLTKGAKRTKLNLPTSKQLKQWERLLCSKAEKWDKDYKKGGMTLFLENDPKFPSIRGQVFFYSSWLGQEMALHTGSRHVQKSYTKGALDKDETSFFYKWEIWDTAVYKAYEQIKHKLDKRYKLTIWSHYESKLNFEFSYEEGGVTKKERYKFDGETVEDPRGSKQKV